LTLTLTLTFGFPRTSCLFIHFSVFLFPFFCLIRNKITSHFTCMFFFHIHDVRIYYRVHTKACIVWAIEGIFKGSLYNTLSWLYASSSKSNPRDTRDSSVLRRYG
jgi:hypothetical protein